MILTIISICDILFYDEKIIVKSGVFNKSESQTVFSGVYSVSLSQSFMGRIFGYGDISVDCPGKWDIDTFGIKDPAALKRYLESKITSSGIQKIITN